MDAVCDDMATWRHGDMTVSGQLVFSRSSWQWLNILWAWRRRLAAIRTLAAKRKNAVLKVQVEELAAFVVRKEVHVLEFLADALRRRRQSGDATCDA